VNRFAALLVTFGLIGCPRPGGQGIGTRVTTIDTAPSGKILAIYSSTTFSTEARVVPADVVVQGMRASSMFFEEDIRALVPEITPALATLEEDQRIVIETNDTAVHVFVSASTGELQIISFRQGQEVSRHASAIPATAVKTELASKPKPAHPVQPSVVEAPPPHVEPPPRAAPPIEQPPTPPEPPKEPAKVTKKPATQATKQKTKPAPRLTEAEIRAKLDELDRLRAKGLITDAEYEQKRKALLDQL
jgi:hypothetical protein